MNNRRSSIDLKKLIITISPILIFIFLVPFMHTQVPYHSDLFGNVDGTGSKWILFGIVSVLSFAIYYIYGKKNKQKVVYFLVLTMLTMLNILLLTGAIFKSENLFEGFYLYFSTSYGNQVTFLLFCVSLTMYLFVERIPPNSIIGIRNSVTSKSEIAWKIVHSRSRMQFWFCAMTNLLIFLIPTLSDLAKLIISFAIVIFCWIYILNISYSVSRKLE